MKRHYMEHIRFVIRSVYLFAAWRVQPGGVGRGQDGDTRQLSGSP